MAGRGMVVVAMVMAVRMPMCVTVVIAVPVMIVVMMRVVVAMPMAVILMPVRAVLVRHLALVPLTRGARRLHQRE